MVRHRRHDPRRWLVVAVSVAALGALALAPAVEAKPKTYSMSLSGTYKDTSTGTVTPDVQDACTVSGTVDERAAYTITAVRKGGTFAIPGSASFYDAHVKVKAVGSLNRTTTVAITNPSAFRPCSGQPLSLTESCSPKAKAIRLSFSFAGTTLTVQTFPGTNDQLGPTCPVLASHSAFQFVSDPVQGKVPALKRLGVGKSATVPFKLNKSTDGGSGITRLRALALKLKIKRLS